MILSNILRFIHATSVSFGPFIVLYIDIKYVGTRFSGNDRVCAINMFNLVPRALFTIFFTFSDPLFLSRHDIEAVFSVCISLGSIKFIEKQGYDKLVPITRFFSGFALASTFLRLLLPSLENSILIKIFIGLILTPIVLLTPKVILMLSFLNAYSDIIYDAIVNLTQFNFFNYEMNIIIFIIFFGACVIPRLQDEEF